MSAREATESRNTKETDVEITLCLDDGAQRSADTGLPFLDHMLDAMACHGRFGLTVKARGDLEVDPHHLVEDLGIVLGTALDGAVGEGGAVVRAGHFSFPMDGSLAQVAVDLCGRPNLVWNVPRFEEAIGVVDPNLFRDFFKGLCDGARATVHVNLPYSDNEHHAVEAVFKAFGRALSAAVRPADSQGPLSTKGAIDA